MGRGRSFLVRQALIARQLGHELEVENYGVDLSKWRVTCSCGYASTRRRTQVLALSAGMHHLGGVAADARASGLVVDPGDDDGVSPTVVVRPSA